MKCHRHKGSEVVLLCAKRTLHKQGEKKSKEGKKDKYRISSFFLGIGEWRKCSRQRQWYLSETPLGDLPLVHKFMLQKAVFKVFVGGVAVLSTRTGLPHPLLVPVIAAN